MGSRQQSQRTITILLVLTTFALVSVGINTAVNFMGGYIGFMLQPDPTQLCSAYHTKKYSTNNHFIYSVTFVSLFADLIIASGLEIVIIRLWFWSRRKRSWEDNSEGISFSSLVAMYIVNSIALLISIVQFGYFLGQIYEVSIQCGTQLKITSLVILSLAIFTTTLFLVTQCYLMILIFANQTDSVNQAIFQDSLKILAQFQQQLSIFAKEQQEKQVQFNKIQYKRLQRRQTLIEKYQDLFPPAVQVNQAAGDKQADQIGINGIQSTPAAINIIQTCPQEKKIEAMIRQEDIVKDNNQAIQKPITVQIIPRQQNQNHQYKDTQVFLSFPLNPSLVQCDNIYNVIPSPSVLKVDGQCQTVDFLQRNSNRSSRSLSRTQSSILIQKKESAVHQKSNANSQDQIQPSIPPQLAVYLANSHLKKVPSSNRRQPQVKQQKISPREWRQPHHNPMLGSVTTPKFVSRQNERINNQPQPIKISQQQAGIKIATYVQKMQQQKTPTLSEYFSIINSNQLERNMCADWLNRCRKEVDKEKLHSEQDSSRYFSTTSSVLSKGYPQETERKRMKSIQKTLLDKRNNLYPPEQIPSECKVTEPLRKQKYKGQMSQVMYRK